MNKQKIAIVGTGIGGLATGLRLSKLGFEVDVFEKLPCPGGRNNLLVDGGFKFDMGPSFILMPDFFEELFSFCGEKLSDHLDLACIDPSYKIFYSDNECLTVHRDSLKTKEELERFEPGASKAFDDFINETRRIYVQVRPLLGNNFQISDLTNPRYWPLLAKIRPFESYWRLAKRFFKSEKLCYAFTFEAMFMGVSPYEAPAFYSIISYADHVQKIFHPMGGMYQLPLALERLARKFGCRFHYNS
ncbi:MAG TPA: NAD(P)-binding protein, partial [Candidatus Omnitrophota bacterium]|nr:NAD(P)-binding protein [Candidatus Omnitrophota bacterium]